MGVMIIGAYRPKPGKEAELLAAIRDHVPLLHSLGFATDRPAYVGKSSEGVYVEVFEWVSQEAIDEAHDHARVGMLWERFVESCTYESIGSLPEAQGQFAHFTPVDL